MSAIFVVAHAIFWAYVLLTMNHPGNPFANLGAWLDVRARRKTLRLLHRVTFACDPKLPIPAAWWP